MPGPGSARGQAGTRGLRALPLPPSPAPLLRAWASGAHACAALLRLRRLRVRRAPAPDFRARLRVLRPGVGAALLPGAPGALRAQPPVPVRACGAGWAAHPRPGARRPRLLAFQASCAPAPGSRDRCPEEGGPRCLRVYAGLIGRLGGLGRAGRRRQTRGAGHTPWGSPAGTVVTPNYLDNVSARVAPWCGCAASGNRREECEAFRKLFTRNPCLGEGAWRSRGTTDVCGPIQAAWPVGLIYVASCLVWAMDSVYMPWCMGGSQR